jgi:hypothetical protein
VKCSAAGQVMTYNMVDLPSWWIPKATNTHFMNLLLFYITLVTHCTSLLNDMYIVWLGVEIKWAESNWV